MSTQYNNFQAPYDLIRRNTISLLERENIRTTVLPHIKDARILDLACGTGFYSYAFLSWGAASMVGVDISSGMLDAARRACPADVTLLDAPSSPSPPSAPEKQKRKKTVTFIEADISSHPPSGVFSGGNYDIVFAAWLLNFAPDRTALTNTYATIARNLRPDGGPGIFLSVTLPPTPHPRDATALSLALRPWSKGGTGGLLYEALQDVDDEGGIVFRVHGETAAGELQFDDWWLVQRAYEECAREGGMRGELRWGKTEAGGWLERGEWEGGATREEMESYEVFPGYGVLMVRRE